MDFIEGEGLSKVLLLHDSYFSYRHHMTARLLQRAGIDGKKVYHASLTGDDLLSFCRDKGVKVVVPLGERALGWTIGESDILRWRGRAIEHKGLWVVPTFQPGKLLPQRGDPDEPTGVLRHPPRFQGVWGRDLHLALDIAANGYVRRDGRYIGDPTVEVFEGFIEEYEAALTADPSIFLSWDIETPYKLKQNDEGEMEEAEFDTSILRISFAFRPGYALTVAWAHPYLSGIRRLLANPANNNLTWNGQSFDVPVVREQGYAVGGTVYDMMDGWHFLQSDLPKGLEFVSSFYCDVLPWKHLNNADPLLYSALDADVALQNGLGIKADLEKAGAWETFLGHSVKLMPILREAGQRGNAIDLVKQGELRTQLESEKARLIGEAQSMVPEELKPLHRYKTDRTLPEVVQLGVAVPEIQRVVTVGGRTFVKVMVPNEVNVCTNCGAIDVTKGEHTGKKVVSKTLKTITHHKKCAVNACLDTPDYACDCPKGWPKKTWDIVENPCYKVALKKETHPTLEWDEILPFNPNSGDQIRSYIRHFNHPMGQDKKDSSKETADKKHLEVLAKKYGAAHPIYPLGIEISGVAKTLGTYVNGVVPDERGRIKTEYTNSTSTWRLGSRKIPNGAQMQNWSKRDEHKFSLEVRRQIIPSPGCVFVQADSSAIEAVMVGWLVGSDEYMTLATEGIHDYVTCVELELPFNADSIAVVKSKHKAIRERNKRVVHGSNYGMTPFLMAMLYPDIFPTKRAATIAQDRYFAVFPALARWQHDVRVRAQKETVLRNPWQVAHRFYDVFTQGADGKVKHGKDSKRAIAFLPQSSAASFMRDSLVMVGDTEWRQYLGANCSVHDSICLDVPAEKKDAAIDYLVCLLTRPIPQMGGLVIGCEVEVGNSWGDLESVKKVKGRLPERSDFQMAA